MSTAIDVALREPPVLEPRSAADIGHDLVQVGEWGLVLWRSFAAEEFFAALGDGWSPADNLRHLTRSNRPVGRALGVPKLVLLLRFGFARRPSRSYPALRGDYQAALSGGLRAGRFAPEPLAPDERTAERRAETLDRYAQSIDALGTELRGWSERALDRLRLPHPGIGMLTVREMLFFTVYHNLHHALGASRRVAALGALAESDGAAR